MDLPRRKQILLRAHDASAPGACFVTVCTHDRRCLLSDIAVGARPRAPRRPVWDALRYQQNDVQEDFGGVGGIKTAGRDLLPADPSLSFRSCARFCREIGVLFSKSARFFGNSKQKNIERECFIVYNVIN